MQIRDLSALKHIDHEVGIDDLHMICPSLALSPLETPKREHGINQRWKNYQQGKGSGRPGCWVLQKERTTTNATLNTTTTTTTTNSSNSNNNRDTTITTTTTDTTPSTPPPLHH